MIDSNVASNLTNAAPNLNLISNNKKTPHADWFSRSVRWFKEDDEREPLLSMAKKVLLVFLTFFLSISLIGIPVVYCGYQKWRELDNASINRIHQIPSDPTLIADKKLENLISKQLSEFNNSKVKGQVNGIYITSNEIRFSAIVSTLSTHPRHPERLAIHIGCAGWHNLDIMCARKSDYGLVIDFNPKNRDFIRKTIELINVSDTRENFNQAMIDYLNGLQGKERELFFHKDQKGSPVERVTEELNREGSWLSTDENYLFIKSVVSGERLVAITENITNHKNFAAIKEYLCGLSFNVDTLYLSNICNFMKTPEQKEQFTETVKSLLDENTIFISCPLVKVGEKREIILVQHALLGKEVLTDTFDTSQLFTLNRKVET